MHIRRHSQRIGLVLQDEGKETILSTAQHSSERARKQKTIQVHMGGPVA